MPAIFTRVVSRYHHHNPPPQPTTTTTTTIPTPPLTATTASPSPARRHPPPAPYTHPHRHSQQQQQQQHHHHRRTLHLLTRPPSVYATTARRAPPPPPLTPATSTAFSSSSEELLEAASSPTTTTTTTTTTKTSTTTTTTAAAATTTTADARSVTVLPLQGPRLTHTRHTPMSSRHTPPNPGSYLSTTPSSTTRSNTPIKLPLQMPAPPRSWLGDPDDVPLDTLRTKPPPRAQLLTPQQASQITIPPPPPAPHPSLGDEESRPASRDSDWNSTHPCFPHRNPYVPLDSALYHTTRVIRISRDFMVYGDQAPAYSNVFPDILEPHVTEEQFRAVVARVNADMRRAYDPWGVWNWVDALAGLLTLWLWEEVVDSHCKRVLEGVEAYLEGWNRDMERAGQRAVFVPLRRSGYMNLDIQIPNPLPATDDDDDDATEAKYVDELEEGEEGASETGSTIGPLGSEAGHHSLRMNSMNGRGSSGGGSGARMGSLGSGEYAPEGAGYR